MKLDLQTALKAPSKLSIDFETPGLDWWKERALLLGIYGKGFKGYLNIEEYDDDTLSSFFKDFVKNRSFIFHNAKFDLHHLNRWINIDDIVFSDTLILAYMNKENEDHRLEQLSPKYLGDNACIEKLKVNEFLKKCKPKDRNFKSVPIDLLGARAVEDSRNTYNLYNLFRPKVYNTSIYSLEINLVKILLKMEKNGVYVDKKYLEKLDKELLDEINGYINKYSDVNLNSPKQLVGWFFKDLGIKPIVYTNKGAPSTKTAALEEILRNHEYKEMRDLLAYRKIEKLQSSFTSVLLEKIDALGKIHADFKQVGTETGRLSCVKPNLQQMPSKSPVIRSAFVSDSSLWTFDYSQMEAVLYAYYNDEKQLLGRVKKGIDVYKVMAGKIYDKPYTDISNEERKKTKAIFLGLMYGMGRNKFESTTGATFEKVQGVFNKASLQRKLNKKVIEDGYVETMFGRRRHLKPEESYKAINTIIQGSSADIMKMAMIKMPVEIQDKIRLTVHDELVLEDLTKEEAINVAEIMSSFNEYLSVSIGHGKTWWDCKKNEMKLEDLKNG